MTFAQLFEWWWKEYGSRLRGENEPFARKRLLQCIATPLKTPGSASHM